jgi:hypothetical protein
MGKERDRVEQPGEEESTPNAIGASLRDKAKDRPLSERNKPGSEQSEIDEQVTTPNALGEFVRSKIEPTLPNVKPSERPD